MTHTVTLSSDHARYRAPKPCGECGGLFGKDPRYTWASFARQKYCSQDCAAKAWSRERIAKRASREDAFGKWFTCGDGCWEWRGAVDRDGYGIFSYAGKSSRAARVALELDGRAPKPGEHACHHCDNPSCVRPDHLFPGTNQDNMRDMVRKGRNPDRFGENNPNYRHGKKARQRS